MNLVLALTGATGAYAAEALLKKSPWPVTLVASDWGKDVYRRECGAFEMLAAQAKENYENSNLAAPISSGTVPTHGMVILPCSANALAKIACGLSDTLISRAAHCHLKERRKLVLCVREAPWTAVDLENAVKVTAAGGIIMPLSPPFYFGAGKPPTELTAAELLEAYADHVLGLLGHPSSRQWNQPIDD
jgi:4-hydroxy-3-polyprenylbenzoate decarboxylase